MIRVYETTLGFASLVQTWFVRSSDVDHYVQGVQDCWVSRSDNACILKGVRLVEEKAAQSLVAVKGAAVGPYLNHLAFGSQICNSKDTAAPAGRLRGSSTEQTQTDSTNAMSKWNALPEHLR